MKCILRMHITMQITMYDTMQSTVMPQFVVCMIIRLSVMFRYRDRTGENLEYFENRSTAE